MAKNQNFGLILTFIFAVGILIYVVTLISNKNNKPIQNKGNYVDGELNNENDFNLTNDENINENLSGTMQDDSIDINAAPLNNFSKSHMDATSTNGNLNSFPENNEVLGNNSMGLKSADASLENFRTSSCFPKDQLTPAELLPQDNSSTWASVNPEGQGTLKDKNFLQAGHHIGINTVGQTLRNSNLQLRSEPPNPQVQISPWMQSTINPDMNRKPLEIGGCA